MRLLAPFLLVALLLALPAETSAAFGTSTSSFGSVWSGLVERVDGEVAHVRLDRCVSLWKDGDTSSCGKDSPHESRTLHFARERILSFATPLDLVAVSRAEGWLPGAGDRVTVRESFARLCGGNRPDCESGPVVPSYVLEKPAIPGMGSVFFWPSLLVGGAAAFAGSLLLARGWREGAFKIERIPSAVHAPGALA